MNTTTHSDDTRHIDAELTFRLPTLATNDGGKVRLGGQGPAFRLADAGRVRLGGQGPLFR